jgi:hypothetical protein
MSTTKTPAAGEKLRADLDAALEHASRECGQKLQFDEREQFIISMAAEAADRAVMLRQRLNTELAGKSSADAVAKLAAELRLTERAAVDLAMKAQIGVGIAKSPRHVAAGKARWRSAATPG